MGLSTLVASRTETASGTAAISLSKDLASARSAVIQLEITADESTASDTFNVRLQHSIDGTNWDDFVSFTQHLGNTGAKRYRAQWVRDMAPTDPEAALVDGSLAAGTVNQGPIGATIRAKWTIVDDSTNASFTFNVTAEIQR